VIRRRGEWRFRYNSAEIAVMGRTAPERRQRAKMVVVINPSEWKPSMGKSTTELSSVTRIGLDLAKKAFQVHGVKAKSRGRYRAQVAARLGDSAPIQSLFAPTRKSSCERRGFCSAIP
jgi:hypothetical protein